MKESFVKPEMEVIPFDGEDVIVTSACAGYCGFDCNPFCKVVCSGDCSWNTKQSSEGCPNDSLQ